MADKSTAEVHFGETRQERVARMTREKRERESAPRETAEVSFGAPSPTPTEAPVKATAERRFGVDPPPSTPASNVNPTPSVARRPTATSAESGWNASAGYDDSTPPQAGRHTFTDNTGNYSVDGELVGVDHDNGVVRIKTPTGHTSVPLTRLSPQSRQYVSENARANPGLSRAATGEQVAAARFKAGKGPDPYAKPAPKQVAAKPAPAKTPAKPVNMGGAAPVADESVPAAPAAPKQRPMTSQEAAAHFSAEAHQQIDLLNRMRREGTVTPEQDAAMMKNINHILDLANEARNSPQAKPEAKAQAAAERAVKGAPKGTQPPVANPLPGTENDAAPSRPAKPTTVQPRPWTEEDAVNTARRVLQDHGGDVASAHMFLFRNLVANGMSEDEARRVSAADISAAQRAGKPPIPQEEVGRERDEALAGGVEAGINDPAVRGNRLPPRGTAAPAEQAGGEYEGAGRPGYDRTFTPRELAAQRGEAAAGERDRRVEDHVAQIAKRHGPGVAAEARKYIERGETPPMELFRSPEENERAALAQQDEIDSRHGATPEIREEAAGRIRDRQEAGARSRREFRANQRAHQVREEERRRTNPTEREIRERSARDMVVARAQGMTPADVLDARAMGPEEFALYRRMGPNGYAQYRATVGAAQAVADRNANEEEAKKPKPQAELDNAVLGSVPPDATAQGLNSQLQAQYMAADPRLSPEEAQSRANASMARWAYGTLRNPTRHPAAEAILMSEVFNPKAPMSPTDFMNRAAEYGYSPEEAATVYKRLKELKARQDAAAADLAYVPNSHAEVGLA